MGIKFLKKGQIVVDKEDLIELYKEIVRTGDVSIRAASKDGFEDVRRRFHELYERAGALCHCYHFGSD